jgi:hypothetical protein
VPGEIYFSVNFLDDEMQIPQMEALVFLEKAGAGHVFQDAASFLAGLRRGDSLPDNPVILHTRSETGINGIYIFEEALNVLLRCSLRRWNC